MAAATSATPEYRCACRRPWARTRSIQPVSAQPSPPPSVTSGWASRSRMKLLLVAPPSITTVVSETARRSRASASSRELPTAMILAIIESKSAGIVSPSPTPVYRAVPDPEGPGMPVAVRDHLHLDVAGSRHELLEEHHPAAEGPLGLVASALVGLLQVCCAGHLADSPAASARGGLEHQRVA